MRNANLGTPAVKPAIVVVMPTIPVEDRMLGVQEVRFVATGTVAYRVGENGRIYARLDHARAYAKARQARQAALPLAEPLPGIGYADVRSTGRPLWRPRYV